MGGRPRDGKNTVRPSNGCVVLGSPDVRYHDVFRESTDGKTAPARHDCDFCRDMVSWWCLLWLGDLEYFRAEISEIPGCPKIYMNQAPEPTAPSGRGSSLTLDGKIMTPLSYSRSKKIALSVGAVVAIALLLPFVVVGQEWGIIWVRAVYPFSVLTKTRFFPGNSYILFSYVSLLAAGWWALSVYASCRIAAFVARKKASNQSPQPTRSARD
jgi:hypothetical protein